MRRLFIISDLHLGGRPDEKSENGVLKTGFQICNAYSELVSFIDWVSASRPSDTSEELELIINGDIVDFLAEDDFDASLSGAQIWTISDEEAVAKFNCIVERAQDANGRGVFEALKDFLDKGHRLTLLLGNHDIELSLPSVRARLLELLGGERTKLQFIYDGEAYTVGRVLIEHGNRYDQWNMIDYSGLRQERSMRSRKLPLEEAEREDQYFVPPAGTFLVIHFMNRIKSLYRFVDLLKPETNAVLPLLLALEPERRKYLKEILNVSPVIRNYIRHGLRTAVIPKNKGDMRASKRIGETEVTLDEILRQTLTPDEIKYFGDIDQNVKKGNLSSGKKEAVYAEELNEIKTNGSNSQQNILRTDGDMSRVRLSSVANRISGALDWFKMRSQEFTALTTSVANWTDLFVSNDVAEEQSKQLYAALKHLTRNDNSFKINVELSEYFDAAAETAKEGKFDVIVYGHTHLPKKISLSGGNKANHDPNQAPWYLNSGTWCDVMRLPAIFKGDYEEAKPALEEFVAAIKTNNYQAYVRRYLSFVEILVDPTGKSQVEAPQLYSYCGQGRERSAPLTNLL